MNAYQLADKLDFGHYDWADLCASMLRQQADRIVDLETTLAFKTPQRLTYAELGELAEKAEKESIFRVRIKPDGGISIHPMLEVFAELIQERCGVK